MGCGQSADKYHEQNKQGIYPPEQISEELQKIWDEYNPDSTNAVGGDIGKKIVEQTIQNLGKVSHSEKCLDEAAFTDQSKKYKGWGALKLSKD